VKEWDVFLSHASDDKETVAMPLAQALVRSGVRVWLDSFEIRLGDSIRAKIDEGLALSRFGVAILSEIFFHKLWTGREIGWPIRKGRHFAGLAWHRFEAGEAILSDARRKAGSLDSRWH